MLSLDVKLDVKFRCHRWLIKHILEPGYQTCSGVGRYFGLRYQNAFFHMGLHNALHVRTDRTVFKQKGTILGGQ